MTSIANVSTSFFTLSFLPIHLSYLILSLSLCLLNPFFIFLFLYHLSFIIPQFFLLLSLPLFHLPPPRSSLIPSSLPHSSGPCNFCLPCTFPSLITHEIQELGPGDKTFSPRIFFLAIAHILSPPFLLHYPMCK